MPPVTPLVSLDHLVHAYGHLPLLDDASLQIGAGERVCLIGRNGTGKSTLLRIVSGEEAPQAGRVWRQPALRIGRLAQDAEVVDDRSVFDVVADGLGDLGGLAAAYHHAAVEVAALGDETSLAALGRLQQALEERDGWRLEQRVEHVLARLDLPADARVATLSGGWRRRVLLARALVGEPDLLLLDEPTNHLDIEAMTWLETVLVDAPGAVLFVTHDRAFLQRVATRIVELDRGRLTSWPCDYATYLERKEAALANEAAQQREFDRRLAGEEAWLRQGIKARRTRDEGRVRALLAMREERAARRAAPGRVQLQAETAEPSGRMVIEAEGVSKSFGATAVVRDLSVRVMRGDRIGLIGPNGSGKTTLLRLLIGELTPDAGDVRRGAGVTIAYYDQQREQLDPERSVFDTVGDGRDTVTINGQSRHVHGYLRDFLFPPGRAASPVKALSGGERNRLLLARLFTRPANLLVLDEPTNDLDIETLELLEAFLIDWPGTLLLVSHDRVFIDHVVTSTLVFEGDGRVQEYVGGYEDWLRQRPEPVAASAAEPHVREPAVVARLRHRRQAPAAGRPTASSRSCCSFRRASRRLEDEQRRLEARIAAPDFYKAPADAIREALARIDVLQQELLEAYARWDELDSRSG
jgi:ABC transport system ATP-binding/permease protein